MTIYYSMFGYNIASWSGDFISATTLLNVGKPAHLLLIEWSLLLLFLGKNSKTFHMMNGAGGDRRAMK